ncbi:PTS system, lactose/cellobiose family IIC subunit [Coriobacterium glomerans PW2]|uniref:Permease IIC component n=1 Tax=Coriobacterium glomerans (strain ATCC 49209 / DSM 20642 / JCM 10262 / PW2) TaxID=700015 RepID=F2NAZ2_CORGP|nr:PTS transporter subunit EIIC [Coriobacterium glomerans]AEB07670.1 PTS system, lactose/cellobiose family IIC subunit [Coriobacterium glomerans PW2]
MEDLFNSPVMIKLQKFGQMLGRNKFLSGLQGAMMSSMGVIMVGALFQIICSVGGERMLGLFTTGDNVYNILYSPYNYTMNMLSLWITGMLAYNYARNVGIKSPIISAVEALAAFLLCAGTLSVTESGNTVMDTTYLGAQGMFVGFIVAFASVRVDKICVDRNIYIKMPDIVPQFLQDGFAGIVPMLVIIAIFLGVQTLVTVGTGGAYSVCSGFMFVFSAPLNTLTSVPGMFVLCIFAGLLWCFGIHGTMILVSVIMPLSLQAAVANGAAHAAGQALVFYPVALFYGMSIAGGTGNTLPLVLMSLRSKSEQMRAVAKAGLIPGWFNINEPVTFGMPIMYNPVLCIPYVLNIPLVMLFWYIGYATGIIIPRWISVGAVLPMGFGSYLTTLNPMNAVWDYLSIIPAGIVWFPFFKAYERQLVAKEQAAKEAELTSAAA